MVSKDRVFRRGSGWWIAYSNCGKEIRESEETREKARALLRARLREIASGGCSDGR